MTQRTNYGRQLDKLYSDLEGAHGDLEVVEERIETITGLDLLDQSPLFPTPGTFEPSNHRTSPGEGLARIRDQRPWGTRTVATDRHAGQDLNTER